MRKINETMMRAVIVALAMLAAGPALAHRVRVAIPVPVYVPVDRPVMIELRPGYWVSTWGCTLDEGQGRLRDCSNG
jgi:hypothetical protein